MYWFIITDFRLKDKIYAQINIIRIRQRHQEIFLNLWWPEPYQRLLPLVLPIHMKSRGHVCVKKVVNTINSGKPCIRYGKKRVELVYIGMLNRFYMNIFNYKQFYNTGLQLSWAEDLIFKNCKKNFNFFNSQRLLFIRK